MSVLPHVYINRDDLILTRIPHACSRAASTTMGALQPQGERQGHPRRRHRKVSPPPPHPHLPSPSPSPASHDPSPLAGRYSPASPTFVSSSFPRLPPVSAPIAGAKLRHTTIIFTAVVLAVCVIALLAWRLCGRKAATGSSQQPPRSALGTCPCLSQRRAYPSMIRAH